MKVTGKVDPVKKITMATKAKKDVPTMQQWWLADSEKDLCNQVLATATYLKDNQSSRFNQAAIYARLYGNQSLASFVGSNTTKMDVMNGLPADRPTFNIIQSCVDTLISKISQNRPSPVFLTDNSDYKERRLAKQLNNFVQGEFYQTKAYDKSAIMLRDALVEGTGVLHGFRTADDKVGLERVLLTELLTDPNDSIYGEPRQMHRLKLVDRDVLIANSPKLKSMLAVASAGYPTSDTSKTVADLVMVVESWHLPSGKDSNDGRHVIACSSGIILDEEYKKDKFPFVFLHFSQRLLGFWAQGLAEQLMGTQLEINSLLYTITRAIRLTGVPRVFVEAGSKVSKAYFNNDIGAIIPFTGTKPIFEVAQSNAPELYEQLQRLITYGFQQAGVSAMQATSQKPQGLNSGEAIRSYDDISNDRFNSLSRKYDNVFIDLAYLVTDIAMDICKDTGKYQTIYPNRNGAKQIDLPKMTLLQDPFVIQCFNMSSLPRDPAGRMQKIVEMIQAGMIDIKEGRRLLDYPDLEQNQTLANASEERIFKILDEIVEDGKYTPPDQFMDLQLANTLTVQYYNLYVACKLEQERADMLIRFFTQIQATLAAANPPAPPQAPGAPQPGPQAAPMPVPTSPLVPSVIQ